MTTQMELGYQRDSLVVLTMFFFLHLPGQTKDCHHDDNNAMLKYMYFCSRLKWLKPVSGCFCKAFLLPW